MFPELADGFLANEQPGKFPHSHSWLCDLQSVFLGCTCWDVPCLLFLRADFANQSNANMFRGEPYSLRSWVFWSLGVNCQLQLVLSFPSPHCLLSFGKRCSGISRPPWGFATHIKLFLSSETWPAFTKRKTNNYYTPFHIFMWLIVQTSLTVLH